MLKLLYVLHAVLGVDVSADRLLGLWQIVLLVMFESGEKTGPEYRNLAKFSGPR